MQVEVDVKCMETKFDGCGLSGFGDIAHFLFVFKTGKIYLQTMHGGQKIELAQKIHASRG